MSMEELKGKQRRYLRGLGNQLKATVYVGRDGLSEALLQSLEDAYTTRELVKVKLERSCPIERREAGRLLAEASNSHLVQVLGQDAPPTPEDRGPRHAKVRDELVAPVAQAEDPFRRRRPERVRQPSRTVGSGSHTVSFA